MERLTADSTNLTLLRHFIGGDSYVTNHTHRGPLIDFLIERYPEGACVRTWVNGEEIQSEDLDVSVDETDSIVMALDVPNDPVTVGLFLGASAANAALVGTIAIAAFNVVVSLLMQALFPGPKARRAAGKVYDIAGYQNSLALGSPVPEHLYSDVLQRGYLL